MAWTAASLYPDWIELFWKRVRMPPEKRNPDTIARLLDATAKRFGFLDHHMKAGRYMAGNTFTMADIPAGMMLYRWFEMEIERPPMPNVEAWYARLKTRPAYRNSICVPFDDLVGKESF